MKTILKAAICVFTAASLFIALSGCRPTPLIKGIQCSLDEGWLISDDVYFTNNSGQNLVDVNVDLTLIGINGDTRTVHQYWALWQLGEKRQVKIEVSKSVNKIQRIDFAGQCEQGKISYSYYNKQP